MFFVNKFYILQVKPILVDEDDDNEMEVAVDGNIKKNTRSNLIEINFFYYFKDNSCVKKLFVGMTINKTRLA